MGGFAGRVKRGDAAGPAPVAVSDESLAITARRKRGTIAVSVTAAAERAPVEPVEGDVPVDGRSKRTGDQHGAGSAVDESPPEPDPEPEIEPARQPAADVPTTDTVPVVVPPEPVRAVPDIDDTTRRQLAEIVESLDWSHPEQRDPRPALEIDKNGVVFDAPFDPVTEAAIHGHVLMTACQSPYGTRPVALEERWDVFVALTRQVRGVVRLIAQAHHACVLTPSGWIPVAADVGRAINHHLRLDKFVPSVSGAEADWDMSDPLDAVFALTQRSAAARKRSEMRDVLDSVSTLPVPDGHHGSVIVEAIKRRKDGTDLGNVDACDLSAAEDLWQANRIALQGVGAFDMAERLAAFLASKKSPKNKDTSAAA